MLLTLVVMPLRVNGAPALARVDLKDCPSRLPWPVYALAQDAQGTDYALVIAEPEMLSLSGQTFWILDSAPDLHRYVTALPMRAGAASAAAGRVEVIHDDGRQWLVRLRDEEELAWLADQGFAVVRVSTEPLVFPPPTQLLPAGVTLQTFSSNALVAAMVAAVRSNDLVSLVSQITGEEPAAAGGELRVVTTRKTAAGAAAFKATQFGYEWFEALGLNPTYHPWSRSGYVSTNVVGTQVGTVAPDELILIVGHLDCVPSSGRAPGADDNASGSVGVLTAASILSQYTFERSIRYVLFTGEEQGLLGSYVYAADAQAAGDNIKAVLNLDMIAWDATGGPTALLYTRSTTHSSYSNDLAIATTLTNVVSQYGLANALAPVIVPNSSMTYSDHSSFWNRGYPAILGIEHYGSDFNSYYHTANDKLSTLNIPYFTAFVKAAVGTVAHLAQPVAARPFDVVRVIVGDWTATNTSFGATVFHAKHAPAAQEDTDTLDAPWSTMPANPHPAWLKLHTQPGADALAGDARPPDSETIFAGDLSVVAPAGAPVTCANWLRFSHVTPPDPTRIYTARIVGMDDFLLVTNLHDLIAAGGLVPMPALVNATNGTLYGYCDIAPRFLRQDSFPIGLRIRSLTNTQAWLTASIQVGTRIVDALEISTNLAVATEWQPAGVWTNTVAPSAANFAAGWESMEYPADLPAATNVPGVFFRLRRTWLTPVE